MAIYSLSHTPVGRTTHAAGTSGAHARYVTRDGAVGLILGEHMPTEREASRAWLDAQEAADRKNARVIDKVMLALPIEMDVAERAQLVHDFAAEVGGGRIPWLAGIHDRGEDAANPHAHIIFRDRDIDTGKRAVGLSEKGSTERLREIWERVANQALERGGHAARIDRRSLEAQGIDRQAGIHIGPNVLAMEERGIRPRSKPQEVDGRIIDWPEIDRGRTRLDRQAEIDAANENRERETGKGKGKGRGDPAPVELAADRVPDETARRRAGWSNSWVAQRAGLDGLDGRQTESARRSFEAWRAKRPDLAQRSGFDLARYVAFVQRQEAKRDQGGESSRQAAEQAPAEARADASNPSAEDGAATRAEGVHQSSPEAPDRPQPNHAADRQREVSRLRQALGRARERLEALGDRLEHAFTRVREAFKRKRVAGADPQENARCPGEQAMPLPVQRTGQTAEKTGDQLRQLLSAYRRPVRTEANDLEL